LTQEEQDFADYIANDKSGELADKNRELIAENERL
jgi:hypothetical protein